MRVAVLSDLEFTGGAAIACSRLCQSLARQSIEIVRILGKLESTNDAFERMLLAPGRRLGAISLSLEAFDLGELSRIARSWDVRRRLREILKRLRPDAINVHNLHGANWSSELVVICAEYAPVVWTMHDMWSFSGRCGYSYECRKFITGCDATCPTPGEYPALSPPQIGQAWRKKNKLYAKLPDLVGVCPSRWLANESKQGLWREHRVEVIPNGLPLGVYSLVDRRLAREALQLPCESPVVLVAADFLNERRKGAQFIAPAIRTVKTRPLTVLTMGNNPPILDVPGVTFMHLGYVNVERVKVLAYAAADVFVHPAPVDNLPNGVMEAIACGTPVVAFPVGGVVEMVFPDTSGWLAERLTATSLAEAIEKALEQIRDGQPLRHACRALAEAEFSDSLQATRYRDLFESVRK